jgi:hypothetical protein
MAAEPKRKNGSRASPTVRSIAEVRKGGMGVTGEGLPKTRLNLIYKGDEMQTLLEKLQRLGHHGTVTETIAKALRVYEAFLDERENGNQIVVKSRDGSSTIMRLI